MVMRHNRPTVADIRAMKARGQKITMLYVTTLEEAAAEDAAGVDMLSIEARFFSPAMREAAGRWFRSGCLMGRPAISRPLRITCGKSSASWRWAAIASILRPHSPFRRRSGGWKAVGKTADSAKAVRDHVKRLDAIGCFGAELEVVPDRVAELIPRSTPMIMLGMGAGPGHFDERSTHQKPDGD